jgi:hypothetical protein
MKSILRALLLFFIGFAALASATAADPPYPLKHQFTKHGVNKPDISTHPKFRMAVKLPPADYSLQKFFWPDDQDNHGACGAFSASEAFDAIMQRDTGKRCTLSFMDIYQRTTAWPQDAGVNNADLLKTMQSGNVLETTFPYKPDRFGTLLKVTSAIKAERAAHVTLNGYSLDSADLLNAIKRCISQVHVAPIVGTYWYGNQFDERAATITTKDASGKVIKTTRHVIDRPKGPPQGGHDVAAEAFDDNMVFPNGDVGGIEFKNHWYKTVNGKRVPWGDERGCCWVSYKFLCNPKYADDVVAFDQIRVTP